MSLNHSSGRHTYLRGIMMERPNTSELKMGSMTNEDYTTNFLELLRYVPYLKDEKAKIQKFISGFPSSFKDWIEFDEPRLLDEAIRKSNNCYE